MFSKIFGAFNPSLVASLGGQSNMRGEGTVDRKEEIVLTIAALVTQVLPNGNLVIHGSQEVLVNFEKRVLRISGVIRPEDIALAHAWAAENAVDAIISTDGDSDRPLVADATGTWLRGDIVGLLCAHNVAADVVVTPVSSNTVLELSKAVPRVVRTRIGSPYVIAAMMDAAAADPAARVCGYEANGGFLLGSAVGTGEGALAPLPTRDALLPIVAALVAARQRPLADVVASLPPRHTFSDRVADFPLAHSAALIALLADGDEAAQMARAARLFGAIAGLPVAIDRTDGHRIGFADGAIIHLRPSGNAPELRCYTEADSEVRARALNQAALAHVLNTIVPEATG